MKLRFEYYTYASRGTVSSPASQYISSLHKSLTTLTFIASNATNPKVLDGSLN